MSVSDTHAHTHLFIYTNVILLHVGFGFVMWADADDSGFLQRFYLFFLSFIGVHFWVQAPLCPLCPKALGGVDNCPCRTGIPGAQPEWILVLDEVSPLTSALVVPNFFISECHRFQVNLPQNLSQVSALIQSSLSPEGSSSHLITWIDMPPAKTLNRRVYSSPNHVWSVEFTTGL